MGESIVQVINEYIETFTSTADVYDNESSPKQASTSKRKRAISIQPETSSKKSKTIAKVSMNKRKFSRSFLKSFIDDEAIEAESSDSDEKKREESDSESDCGSECGESPSVHVNDE
jgi:hypothetical protein